MTRIMELSCACVSKTLSKLEAHSLRLNIVWLDISAMLCGCKEYPRHTSLLCSPILKLPLWDNGCLQFQILPKTISFVFYYEKKLKESKIFMSLKTLPF